MVEVLEIGRIVIVSDDLAATVEQFERLGLEFGEEMRFQLGDDALSGRIHHSGVDIITPEGENEISRHIETQGRGMYALSLRVSDARAARDELAEAGVEPFQKYREGEFLEFFYHPRHFSGVMVILAEYPMVHPLEAAVMEERRESTEE
jgi:hypothetical protein